ncbi:sensor histidine kinase [Microbacterium sp. I2]|uniref:sensor histidine kinase n=1 Tax=Microbacterium sp. I2 TaxID=3391826 RepID=UPI003ED988F9
MPAAPRVRSALSYSLDRALVVIAMVCGALTITEIALFPFDRSDRVLLWSVVVIFVIYVVAGLIAWKRRPSNGMGALILMAGMTVYVGSIANTGVPLLEAIGAIGATLVIPAVAHLLLAFPVGRLPDRTSRVLVAAVYATALVLQAPKYLLNPDGPYPPFAIADLPEAAAFLGLLQTIAGTSILVLIAGVLWGRLRRADVAHRRVLIPLFSYGIFTVLFMPLIAIALDRVFHIDPDVRAFLQFAAIGGIPIAFVLGMLRGGFARTAELEELGTWLGAADTGVDSLTTALARTLGDPSLRLYIGATSEDPSALHRFAPYADTRPESLHRRSEPIELEGRTIGHIEYDAALVTDRELVQTAGRIVALAAERQRLTTELLASQRALVRSRERIVEAADLERRRIARDLHDGLQVKLVLLALEAQQMATATPATVGPRATRLRQDIDAAAAEVRTLVRDLVPAALIERGLAAAAEDLSDRMPISTEFESHVGDAIGDLVQTTTYFVLAEALANVVKHAGASVARVRLVQRDGWLRLDVEDDGAGGASLEGGTGLRGLADRVEAIGGRLSISSPRGKGTHVWAELPCASS